ncbi:MAG: RagB/SusD family nutrient uptake outer membrane protein [Gemmatimonadales bacterium]
MAVAALLLAGCSTEFFDLPNTNAPTQDQLTGAPTKSILARAAVGVAASFTNDVIGEITQFSYLGREGWNLQGNDPRLTVEMVRGPQDPGGHSAGSYNGKYQALRSVNTYLEGIDAAPDMTDAEKAASKGFAKTLKAIILHRLIVRNNQLGTAVDVEAGLDAPPAPFLPRDQVYTRIAALLDEANTDLGSGGAAFPFTVPPGYAGFDTPSTFRQFNRAYMAKVQAHIATFLGTGATAYTAALTALGQSFIDPAGDLQNGVYYAYSPTAPEPANTISQAVNTVQYYVHQSVKTGVQLKANNDPDERYTSKVAETDPRTQNDLTSSLKPVMYNVPATLAPDLGADIPVIKNEELILLRAEARWFTGDKSGALTDINTIRVNSGGLAPTTLTTGSSDQEFITELVYNRLYSLLWEQGVRWTDARRFNLINTLPVDRAGDQIFPSMVIPQDECNARGLQPPCAPAS